MQKILKGMLCLSIGISILFSFPLISKAETTTATTSINIDEAVSAKSLNVSDPKILPTSPFYFLNKWQRKVREFFAFSPIKKIELKEKFASEKLLEAKKLAQKTKDPEILKKAITEYQENLNQIRERLKKIEGKADKNPKIEKFLDKFTKHQILHEKILEKLENKVPEDVLKKIKEAREKHLQVFSEVMNKLENKEKIKERIENNLNKIEGSKFKDFKHIQLLKRMEEKAPEEIKDKIKKAREATMTRLEKRLEKMSSEEQEKFKNYIERISGNPDNKAEIINRIRSKIKNNAKIKDSLRNISTRLRNKNVNHGYEGSPITIDEAREIAKNSECAKVGEISEIAKYNKITNTWWMNIKQFEETKKEMCHPACVVNASTKTAKVNWMCTGLIQEPIMPLNEALEIAKNSECAKIGEIANTGKYSKSANTWWININVYDKIWKEKNLKKGMCHPVCVVNVSTKTAKVNWMCTGLRIEKKPSNSKKGK